MKIAPFIILGVLTLIKPAISDQPVYELGVYRDVKMRPGNNEFAESTEILIYDTTDYNQLSEKQRLFVQPAAEWAQVDFEKEFLLIICVNLPSSNEQVDIDFKIENDSTLVIKLDITIPSIYDNAMSYRRRCFAIRKDRVTDVKVERTYYENHHYSMKSYESRRNKSKNVK